MKWALVVLAACGTKGGDIVGPFSGPRYRYVVDRMTLPTTSDLAMQLGDDLDADMGGPDNQLGTVFAALSSTGDGTTHVADMIASGALASSLVVQATSLTSAARAGASYYGADGDAATAMGGAIVASVYASNRAATTKHPGVATLVVPIFDAADPLVLDLEGAELDFAPDAAGTGLDAILRGGVPIDSARTAATIGVGQMVAADPVRHLVFSRYFDTDHDGIIQPDEIASSSVIGAFLVADLHATMRISVGIGLHLVPCDSGRCGAASTPVDTCADRIVDGDETDVDCGGSCPHKCPAGQGCKTVGDCQTAGCDASKCRAASCSDGIRDGIESDVDCGAITGCALCGAGKVCVNSGDCASGNCNNGPGATGVCQ